MKKTAAALAALAAAGFTGLSMAPASAAPFAFDRCADAYAVGVGNIPEGQPGYGYHLDQPYDGVACENDNFSYDASRVPGNIPSSPVAPNPVNGVQNDVVQDSAVFDNCTEARAAGRTNIPSWDPAYGLHLDADRDGYGCDADGTDDGVQQHEIIDWVPESWNNGGSGYGQVSQVPVGGADTGAEGESAVPGLALAGGLTLAAAAGATVAVRRRAARA
ncbi:excalibur calcium-binding domain-containing protein [Kocuria sp. LUK]|uniref:excalibur calcium-binding domain-containing protein n=1 Tax=Kocuria sp. LUK TaxID=2897828 RepID=UPI001E32FAF0|nr:excalibur calcium-binding domain-containing protein [Kocuria sp. LUK]MCD1144595.1 excalibur calcium-binding domain-containing protein [Kocuria sp. LUK]